MPQARSVSAFNDGREPPGQPLDPSAHSNGLLTVTHLCALPWEFGVPSLGVPKELSALANLDDFLAFPS